RLPKKGFKNFAFRLRFEAVNVSALESTFQPGATVDIDALRAARLVPKSATLWKLLGDGEIKKALTIKADAASARAKEKVKKAGGTVEVPAGEAKERNEAFGTRQAALEKRRAGELEKYRADAAKTVKPTKKAAPAGKGEKKQKPSGGEGAKAEKPHKP